MQSGFAGLYRLARQRRTQPGGGDSFPTSQTPTAPPPPDLSDGTPVEDLLTNLHERLDVRMGPYPVFR